MSLKQGKLAILIIILVIYEDLIRKFVPGHTALIFLIKDFFILVLYGFFLTGLYNNRNALFYSSIIFPLLLLFFYECFSFIWTDNFNFFVFINGLKLDFFYLPLFFLTPYLFKDYNLINKLNLITKITLFLFFIFQIFEIIVPNVAESLLFYSLSEDYDKVFHLGHSFNQSDFIKYYKTFFFSEGKFCDMVFHLYLIFLITSFLLKNLTSRSIVLFSFFSFFMLFMSGKRIFIFLFPFLLLALSFSFYKYKKNLLQFSKTLYDSFKRINMSLTYSFIIIFFVLVYLFYTNETVSLLFQFLYSALSEGIATRYLEEDTLYNYEFFQLIKAEYLWYGQGVGTNSQGIEIFLPDAEYLLNRYEMGYFKFINEHGLFGLLIFIGFIISSLKLDINTIKYSRVITYKIISILILTYHFTIFLRFFNGHQFFGNSQTVFWFWIIMGIQIFLYRNAKYSENANFTF